MNLEKIDALTTALARAFEMGSDDAREIADVVMGHFADAEEVDDENLDAEVRSVFYTLEGKRLLAFRRAEVQREEGHRRAFFWRLRHEALAPAEVVIPVLTEADVYAELPATAWRHSAA